MLIHLFRGKIIVYFDHGVEEKYLSLEELGTVLGKLSQQLPSNCLYS